MTWLIIIFALFALMFGFVLLFGAPYLPTLKPQIGRALDLLDLQPGDTMLELGCGDGRVLAAAAQRGLNAIGYELNPLLVIVAKLCTWKYRRQVRVVWANYWNVAWPKADGIFVFLLESYMKKLDTYITQKYRKNVKLVSYAFQVPGRQADKRDQGMFYYEYRI